MRIKKLLFTVFIYSIFSIVFIGCEDDEILDTPRNPDLASVVSVDRFSDEAATLMQRSKNNALPVANAPVSFDLSDFITQGYGPDGQIVKYYNFDVQTLAPAPLYVLFKEGSTAPVDGQLNIINVIPGDVGYNDFWVVYEVVVPSNYIANTVSSLVGIIEKGYSVNRTTTLVNCPVVPAGSTANLRLGTESSALDRGWYKDQLVYYFTFMEKELETNLAGLMSVSPIYVTFNINPDDMNPNSGPASGSVVETGTLQTHNVIATIPTDIDYSPLWSVTVYNNTDFSQVYDLATAQAADILAEEVMYVNCPVVYME